MSSIADAIRAPSAGILRAGIYTRVSTHEQAEHGYGLDAQMKDCLHLVEQVGGEVVATYEDTDSGTLWTLPGLNAMLDDATRGKLDAVVIYDPDRLSRRLAKYTVVDAELRKAGVAIHYVTVKAGDTPEDHMLLNLKAVFAQFDHERIVMRMARGKRSKAERGQVVGAGPAPYGYRYLLNEKGKQYALEIDPETTPVVVRIFQEATHHSLAKIARGLNADGVLTRFAARTGAGWSPTTVHSVLNHPVYLGTAPYGRRAGGGLHDPSTWIYSDAPALIDQATWDAAHAAMGERKHLRDGRTDHTKDAYLLRGVLTCAHCGGALSCDVVSYKSRRVRYYCCLRHRRPAKFLEGEEAHPRCVLPNVPSDPLDQIAWGKVVHTLLDRECLDAGLAAAQEEYQHANGRRAAQLTILDQEISRYRGRLSRILEEELDAPSGSETARLLREKRNQIEAVLTRFTGEREALASEPAPGLTPAQSLDLARFAAEVRDGIEHATPADQHRILQLLKVRGVVHHDPEHGQLLRQRQRFTIEWTAAIPLRDSVQGITKLLTRFRTTADGTAVEGVHLTTDKR